MHRALTRAAGAATVSAAAFGESHRHVHVYVIPRPAALPPGGHAVLTDLFVRRRWACSAEECHLAAVSGSPAVLVTRVRVSA